MSIQPRTAHEIPEATRTLAQKILPDGNMYMRIRDELGEIFTDEQFTALFAERGQPAQAPGRLALVTIFQSTHILVAVRAVNRLLLVGEKMRCALNDLAQVAPEWVRALASAEWWLRYSRRFDNIRLPKDPPERDQLAEQIGADGVTLEAIRQSPQAADLRALPSVEILRQIWLQQFWTEHNPDGSTRLRLRDRQN